MGKRQRQWARRARLKLIQELGGRCALCGAVGTLEIDHPARITWNRYATDSSWRVSKYRKEAQLGLIRVLCPDCNNRKNQVVQTQLPLQEEDPF